MKFIVDAQLPPALARWISANGHTAWHVAHHNMKFAPDDAIWRFATDGDFVIITKDEDFRTLRIRNSCGPPVVWIRLPNRRRQEILQWFAQIFDDILFSIERGEILIEIG